jgi:hypothetical protein
MTLDLFNQDKKPYTPSYFNTTHKTGEELEVKKKNVVGQNGEILGIFASSPNVAFTPWNIYDKMQGRVPITSVRRAITTLEKENYFNQAR